MDTSHIKRVSPLLLPLVLLALVAIAVASVFRFPLVIDDPFITYRYALNLVSGNGFVFNPGARVLSTTAPLYALVLAVFGYLGLDIPTVGYVLSVAGYVACAIFLYLLGRFYKRNAGLIAGLFILTSPALVLTLGLETGFYLALAFAALYAYARERVTLTFVLLACLTLTRPDGALLALILGVDFVSRRSNARPPKQFSTFLSSQTAAWFKPFGIYLLILAPFLLAAWAWFGSPFPSTLSAKIVQAQSGLWQPFAFGLTDWFGTFARNNPLVVLFALGGLAAAWREVRPALFLAVWGVGHIAAYSILGVAFYAWYVAPFVVALLALAALGIESAVRWIAMRATTSQPNWDKRIAPTIRWGLVTVVTGAIIFINVQQLRASGMDRPDAKAQIYRQVAEWLRANTAPEAAIDALEVGLIGYYDERRTLDFVGLVEPSRLPYLRAQFLSDGVRRNSAEYVVALPSDTWLALDPWFPAAYEPVQKFSAPNFYGGKPLIVYRRVDVGAPPGEFKTLALNFEHGIRLDGFALGDNIRAGARLPIVLQLRASEILSHDFKMTLQLLGANEQVIAQSDTYYPLRPDEDGKPFRDVHSLVIPREVAAGEYRLLLAFYYAPTGERLSILDANGNAIDDRIILTTLQIDAP